MFSVSAVTLDSNQTASVNQSGTAENPVVVFGIPRGAKGDKGAKGVDGKSYACPVYCYLTAQSVTYTREFDGEVFEGYISCKFTIYTTRLENETNITLDDFRNYISYLNDVGNHHYTPSFIPCSGAFTCTDGKDLSIIITGMNFQDFFSNVNSPITFDGVINDMTENANAGASDKTRMVNFDVAMTKITYFVGIPVPQSPI